MSSISANVAEPGLPLRNSTRLNSGHFNAVKPTRTGRNVAANGAAATASRAALVPHDRHRGHNASPVRHPQSPIRIVPAALGSNDTVDPNQVIRSSGANDIKHNGSAPASPTGTQFNAVRRGSNGGANGVGANSDGARLAYLKASLASGPNPQPSSTIDPNEPSSQSDPVTAFDAVQSHAGFDTTG